MKTSARYWRRLGSLLLLGVVVSGCVRHAHSPEGRTYSRGWSDDPVLDDQPRIPPRPLQRPVVPPSRPQVVQGAPALLQLRQAMQRYHRIIRYCQSNHRKVVAVIHRLRRTMAFVQDADEWRYYQGLQKQFQQHLLHNRRCIHNFRQRLTQAQTRYRALLAQQQRQPIHPYHQGHPSPYQNHPVVPEEYAQRGPWYPNPYMAPHQPSPWGGVRVAPPSEFIRPVQPTQPMYPPKKSSPSIRPDAAPHLSPHAAPHPDLQGRVPPSFPQYQPPRFSSPPGSGPNHPSGDLMKPVPSAPGSPSSGGTIGGSTQSPVVPPRTGVNEPDKLRNQTVIPPKVEQGPRGSVMRPVPSPDPQTVPALPEPQVPQPSDPDDAQAIETWRKFCAAENQRSPMVQNVRPLGAMILKSSPSVRVDRFKHVTSESIRPMYGSNPPWVVLGSSMRYTPAHCVDRSYALWDTQRQVRVEKRPAVTAYLLRHRHLIPWFAGQKHAAVEEELVSYQPNHGQGGILLRSPMPAYGKRYNYAYLLWNLNSNRIVRAWTLGLPGCFGAYLSIGTEPSGKIFYYLQSDKAVNGACSDTATSPSSASTPSPRTYRLIALDLHDGSRRTISTFVSDYPRLEAVIPNRDFSQIAVVPYTEMSRAKGQTMVIHIATGQVARFPAPVTPYGVTFSANQEFLLIYSAKTGKISRFHLATGQQQDFPSYPLGHAMGLSLDGKRVFLVFHSGVEVRDADTLKRLQFIPHRPMMGNARFIHVGGSTVFGNTLFIKNGEELFVRSAP